MTGAVNTNHNEELLDEDVKFLSEKTDLSPAQAKELIAKHGRDRTRLLELAGSMKGES